MIQVENADVFIKIGIKSGKVIQVDWSELHQDGWLIDKKNVIRLLKEAVKFMKIPSGEKF
ncbi:MAG TPA: hypothetical protein P5136_01685 [Methanofastidiosum sp.]|nr:hypothetical protein [Methanofastidiosum sp.]